MTIAEMSKRHELTADTLRYYERIGLLPEIERNTSGNREYTEANSNWIHFIKCMRNAGLSIETLIEYVALFKQEGDTTEARKAILIEQRKQLVQKIDDLKDMLTYLDQKISNYEGHAKGLEEKLFQKNRV